MLRYLILKSTPLRLFIAGVFKLHEDVLEDAAAAGGLSPMPDSQMVKCKTFK